MRVDIPEATYHYHIKQLHQEDPDKGWQTLILETFKKHEGRYGYRRIHTELKAQGYIINHKKVQRIMQELDLNVRNSSASRAINRIKVRLEKWRKIV
ncbi:MULTISPECIES: IS3 family transposase [unclassified Lysinibacillus]|uniref:IS3 family transposase n=1 Tax=unclassified Lysinibacillus TaxID=2636778 RepID=UPI00201B463A|nr:MULTISPECIES: IS3 family transposase [unclassified Lysinibacillus]